MSSSHTSVEAPWHAGLRAARANFWPGLVLQAVALALVGAYYFHPPTRAALGRLAEFRAQAGAGFAIISTGLVGGLIPLLYLKTRQATRARYTWLQGAGLIAFWAYKGFEIDLFYRVQAHVFGETANAATIALKMFIDQFVYCPLFAIPVTALFYDWVDARYHGAAIVADMRAGAWYRRRVLPVLISNLGVWVPTVCIIYALPTPLQLPLQNLVLCFFTLMLAHVSANKA
jgi:hypothetical protein